MDNNDVDVKFNASSNCAVDLRGRTALVTGANRGIGKAIALGLAKSGAAVIVHGRSASAALTQVKNEVSAYGVESQSWSFDFTNTDQLEQELALQQFVIDILIINASVEVRENITALTQSAIETQVHCNYVASLLLTQHVVRSMCERGWGRVIGIGSIQEQHVNSDLAVYASLKAAQTHYLKTLAAQVAEQGVTVNILAPGAIFTDRNKTVLADANFKQAVEAKIPMAHIGQPSDCVGAALFFCSDWAKYITGAWLPVDGGFHL